MQFSHSLSDVFTPQYSTVSIYLQNTCISVLFTNITLTLIHFQLLCYLIHATRHNKLMLLVLDRNSAFGTRRRWRLFNSLSSFGRLAWSWRYIRGSIMNKEGMTVTESVYCSLMLGDVLPVLTPSRNCRSTQCIMPDY